MAGQQRSRGSLSVAAYLEVVSGSGGSPRRVIVDSSPYVLGRGDHVDLTIYEQEVSTEHASLELTGQGFLLRDLDSTNGTFVNGQRVDEQALTDGDVVHLAHHELRFRLGRPARKVRSTLNVDDAEQQMLVRLASALNEVLTKGSLVPVYQPIVRLDDRSVVGFESLGRTGPDLRELSFFGLLKLAEGRGQGATLSQVMREIALAQMPPRGAIFFNLHPQEFANLEELERSFDEIVRKLGKDQSAVVEVSESSVTDLEHMGKVRAALQKRGLQLAYDDFGAGQSRLMELAEVPPDYLKLDMALVRDIHLAKNEKRRKLLSAVIQTMKENDVVVIAEGIEQVEEAAVCAELGCALGQGYLFGRPTPIVLPPGS